LGSGIASVDDADHLLDERFQMRRVNADDRSGSAALAESDDGYLLLFLREGIRGYPERAKEALLPELRLDEKSRVSGV
jgi:hypothetical protein